MSSAKDKMRPIALRDQWVFGALLALAETVDSTVCVAGAVPVKFTGSLGSAREWIASEFAYKKLA